MAECELRSQDIPYLYRKSVEKIYLKGYEAFGDAMEQAYLTPKQISRVLAIIYGGLSVDDIARDSEPKLNSRSVRGSVKSAFGRLHLGELDR